MNQGHGVLRLMVFGHIRTGHEDHRFADETEFGNTTSPSTADDKVGSAIGTTHVGNEVRHFQVRDALPLQPFGNLGTVIFTRLPEELDVVRLNKVKMSEYTLVDGTCAKASAHQKNNLLIRIKSEVTGSLFTG